MKTRVLFLSNVPWDFVWQRHQTLASLWAERAEVDYVEIPGMRKPGWRDMGRIFRRAIALLRAKRQKSATGGKIPVRLVRPWVLPAVHPWLCAINSRLIGRVLEKFPELRGPYACTVIYTPARTALQWLERVNAGRIVYDCTDDLTAVRGVPSFFAADEARLMARADVTVVSSRVLYERKSGGARRLARLPHGADTERFTVSRKEVPRGDRVTVLYYGHLHRQHLDFESLERLARARPHWRVILVGPVRSPYRWPANVELPGQVRHDALREWIGEADVLLLPYLINEYTKAVMPAKTYECLATGRPLVSTRLPELVAEFPDELCFVSDEDDWAVTVEDSLKADSEDARLRRIRLAAQNTWRKRFEEFLAIMEAG